MNQIENVAIIMDGNGRWAKSKLRPRVWGHIKGASIINSIAEAASNLELKSLTLYAFSSENWSRPKHEIMSLFKILEKFLSKNQKEIIQKNIIFNVVGNYSNLSATALDLIKETKEKTQKNSGLKLNFAFGYGGRDEIVDAVNSYIHDNPGKSISLNDIAENLYDPEIKEVDLIIRTGGDQRISNFLLWQSAYAEIEFIQKFWPSFKVRDFEEIINKYRKVERRFGGLSNNSSYEESLISSESNKRILSE